MRCGKEGLKLIFSSRKLVVPYVRCDAIPSWPSQCSHREGRRKFLIIWISAFHLGAQDCGCMQPEGVVCTGMLWEMGWSVYAWCKKQEDTRVGCLQWQLLCNCICLWIWQETLIWSLCGVVGEVTVDTAFCWEFFLGFSIFFTYLLISTKNIPEKSPHNSKYSTSKGRSIVMK